jgi:hypothetical protein
MAMCEVCRSIIGHRSGETCPRVQERADAAEDREIAVAGSSFAQWCSSYVASLSALAQAGVKLGEEER